MSKRKGVNDIIYELDNDDIEISSDEEAREPKIIRIDVDNSTESFTKEDQNISIEDSVSDVINIDCSTEDIDNTASVVQTPNGGKSSVITFTDNNTSNEVREHEMDNVDSDKKLPPDSANTMIFNEDIVIDSPASNSDPGVVGCENRTPLLTIRFKDNKMAKNYKDKVKAFMLRLIKLHDEESYEGSETETDLELDIWPEDLIEDDIDECEAPEDNLFFIDTAPCEAPVEVPTYSQMSAIISNIPEQEPAPLPQRRGPICFNCDGDHQLRDCILPRNKARIAEKRKNIVKVGRYHVEDEQKYGHLIPGRISGQLRHALGLKRNEIPLHIYRMRLMGYPPGWLEEARISHSGITMFDSSGTAILDPEEEEGELCEPGSKDKFDIKKILDFPGFNVPTSSRYKEEAHLYDLPPISEQDSKIAMLQALAPNAMKAYKRKKLTFFPSAAANNTSQDSQMEMELDSGDETAEFPSVPPLPDDAPPVASKPPPPPPLPASPPPLPPPESPPPPPPPESPPAPPLPKSPEPSPKSPTNDAIVIDDDDTTTQESNDDVVVIEDSQISDVCDDDDDNKNRVQTSSGRNSPSLDDLEDKKRRLLDALEASPVDTTLEDADDVNEENIDNEASAEVEEKEIEVNIEMADANQPNNSTIEMADVNQPNNSTIEMADVNQPNNSTIEMADVNQPNNSTPDIEDEVKKPPDQKAGCVKTTSYGTPVMNVVSPFLKLPSDDKFSKDICDVINFENLPNSTGKYQKISNLLKKVKIKVDKIHES